LSKDMQAAFASGGEVLAEGLPGKAFARHMLAVDPPDHTRLRRLVASAFSLRRVEGLEPRIREIIRGLLDALAADGPDVTVDLVPRFAFPLPFTVICELLGVPEEDRQPFGDALIALLSPTDTAEQYAKAKAGSDAVVAHLEKLVATKEREPADDLVTDLVHARDGDEHLDHGELLSTLLQLIIAGHDTTTSLIGNGVVALLTHPDQLALVKADPSLVPALVEEIMRFDAPVPHSTFRYAAEDVEIAGVTIPKGGQVIISLAAANHDAAHFHDGETFDITRHDDRHLAFGHGIHFCLGAPLARLEGNIAFTTMLARFPDMRLAVPSQDLHWGHGDGLVLRGLNALPVMLGRDRQL
jgi:cytochrome P450